jgi:FtsZ-interacting cell division protein YlmF
MHYSPLSKMWWGQPGRIDILTGSIFVNKQELKKEDESIFFVVPDNFYFPGRKCSRTFGFYF